MRRRDVGVGIVMALAITSNCAKHPAEEVASTSHGKSAMPLQGDAELRVQTFVIPSGTAIVASLDEPLTAETNVTGDPFTATTLHPIIVGGRVVIPIGSRIHGIVRNVQTSGRTEGRAEITIAFQEIVDVEGKRNAISALPLTLQADCAQNDISGVGTGGIIEGRPDNDIGAGAGEVVVIATKGDFIQLDAGRKLNIQMTGPASLRLATEK